MNEADFQAAGILKAAEINVGEVQFGGWLWSKSDLRLGQKAYSFVCLYVP